MGHHETLFWNMGFMGWVGRQCTDFPTGVDVEQHNCLLIYWHTVWHMDMPTLVCLWLCNDIAKCHILRCGDPEVGLMTPKFELWWDFCTVHLTTKFRHHMFNCSEVIVLTNKQADKQMQLKTCTLLCYAMLVGKNADQIQQPMISFCHQVAIWPT